MKYDIKSKPMNKELAFTAGVVLAGTLKDLELAITNIKHPLHIDIWEKVHDSFTILLLKAMRNIEIESDPNKPRAQRGIMIKTTCLEEAFYKIYSYQLPKGGRSMGYHPFNCAKTIQHVCQEFLIYQGWKL